MLNLLRSEKLFAVLVALSVLAVTSMIVVPNVIRLVNVDRYGNSLHLYRIKGAVYRIEKGQSGFGKPLFISLAPEPPYSDDSYSETLNRPWVLRPREAEISQQAQLNATKEPAG